MDFRTDKLLHGGDYNPEQWLKRPDILEKDIEMLEEAGCNVVSMGMFSWSTLEPEEGVGAIGSGGPYAQAAALALQRDTELSPEEIVRKSLAIAGDLCIYTNQSHIIETLD